jgi:hypothetical protein
MQITPYGHLRSLPWSALYDQAPSECLRPLRHSQESKTPISSPGRCWNKAASVVGDSKYYLVSLAGQRHDGS